MEFLIILLLVLFIACFILGFIFLSKIRKLFSLLDNAQDKVDSIADAFDLSSNVILSSLNNNLNK